MPTPEDSKRIKALRLAIAGAIPKIPNNKDTLDILEAKPLNAILIDYLAWQHRLIRPAPRTVTLEPTVTSDSRWKSVSSSVQAILDKARSGQDLNPHLSLRAFRHGFSPAASSTTAGTDKWLDKDFQLNVTGYHHLHLNLEMEPSGFSKRSSEVLFAHVTRDNVSAIGIFDHSVFEENGGPTAQITAERSRLMELHERRLARGAPPGSILLPPLIATSGHTLQQVRLADIYGRIVRDIDPKLDELQARANIFSGVPHEVVKKMKLAWHLNYLDFGLLDKAGQVFHVLQYGPI